ncbi:hypothetical protein EDD85DRAFT_780972 [Armillaria nabsnona]|nr:hypothetical protein EDD85DRAFT_780972 [Armillaria nabsnona]
MRGDDGKTFLIDFTEGIDLEDAEMTAPEDDLDSNQDKDNTDGFINELTEMDTFEHEAFELEIKPVHMALLKICKLCFKIIHSSTLLLPQWKASLKSEGMPEKILPCDVSTRWNSTFDMLHMVLHYQVAVKKFSADVDNDL